MRSVSLKSYNLASGNQDIFKLFAFSRGARGYMTSYVYLGGCRDTLKCLLVLTQIPPYEFNSSKDKKCMCSNYEYFEIKFRASMRALK